eukprot:NODE_2033_length_1297_cov_56.429060_g1935_i0.p1 GENE.NODE_2033_length_1297_cov_56.429060_g1935_i0~~NODE_2033_length_1297_cov_56.429060_g1935_i0.p1  ORF type:complete len:350 (+),score=74.85 NODE_2033_length_1297_cov_56.429060_g1935_i0:158-1207(+)
MSIYGSFGSLMSSNVNDGRSTVTDYDRAWQTGTVESRQKEAQTLTNHYYDVATDFYEYGWGQSFHFAPRFYGEEFDASLARHEYWLAHRLEILPGMRVLDVGCGVGGPMRAIARFTDARITGLNNNQYQIKRGRATLEREHLGHLCEFVHGDFMKMPFPENTFDRVYAIEATCHAPNKTIVFAEMLRVLKPGGIVALYDWAMTDNYNSTDAEERAIKLGIEHGDSLPDLPHYSVVDKAMLAAGFEVLEHADLAQKVKEEQGDFNVPWYNSLESTWSLSGFKHTPLGRACTSTLVWILESLTLSVKGSYATAMMLEDGASNLVLGGQREIITPMYYIKGRKPTPKKVPLP